MERNFRYHPSEICRCLYSFLEEIEWEEGENEITIFMPFIDFITIGMLEDLPKIEKHYVKVKLNRKQFDFIKELGREL